MNRKNIILVIVVIIIIGAIAYLEHTKPGPITAEDIVLGGDQTNAGTIGTSTATASSTDAASYISDRTAIRAKKAATYPRAKELADPTGFINTDKFKLSDIVGKKVVLLDFWTYSCINCQRTTPYLKAWDDKYRDEGLEIVGIHTPEFDFEKVYDNVAKAVKEAGIKYPVVLDSNYGTWNAYQNRYWPHKLLIDIDGFIVYDHIGEGGYEETERQIQAALKERNDAFGIKTPIDTSIAAPAAAVSMDPTGVQSPETYFGSARNEFLGNGKRGTPGVQDLTPPQTPSANTLYLGGSWNFSDESAESISPSANVIFNYSAKNVYFVASSEHGVKVKILRDGKPVPATMIGEPVAADGTIMIKDNRLYTLIKGEEYGVHTIEIQVQGPGLEAFTFTFG